MRKLVSRRNHQSLAGQRRHRLLGRFVHIGIHIVAVVDAAQLDRLLRRLRKAQARAAAFAGDAQVGDLVIVRLPAQLLRRHFFQPLHALQAHRVRRARHRVRGLAAARGAGVRKDASTCRPRQCRRHPTARPEPQPPRDAHRSPLRFPDCRCPTGICTRPSGVITISPSKPSAATVEVRERNAHAAHLRAHPLGLARHALVPLELLGAQVQRLLQEAARHVSRACLRDSAARIPPCPPDSSRAAAPPGPRPACRAALARIGSMMAIACMPPGALCALRGGVFVATVTLRQRMAGG